MLCLAFSAFGQEPADEQSKRPQPVSESSPTARPQTEQPKPVYKPPKRGAPASRIGGASRGESDPQPTLAVLAPNHTGLTIIGTVRW